MDLNLSRDKLGRTGLGLGLDKFNIFVNFKVEVIKND
jgi:hypothetical protein